MLVSVLIVVILVLCIKTMVFDVYLHDTYHDNDVYRLDTYQNNSIDNRNSTGAFSNNILIDSAGLREGYGTSTLASGLVSLHGDISRYDMNDNDEGDGEGSGNFTDRPRYDLRYLEDVMNGPNQSIPLSGHTWEDLCMLDTDAGTVIGNSCIPLSRVNPKKGYRRSYGESKLIYNTDIADPLFNQNQLKKGALYVPWSETYNNIMPANPYIR
jgi:hypothetical protein